MMILNNLLRKSDRIEIIESFLDNEDYELTLKDVQRIRDIANPSPHLEKLIDIGIISNKQGKYSLNKKDKRVIYLSLINNEEYIRQLEKMDKKGIFEEKK